jgi:hypothetical protein
MPAPTMPWRSPRVRLDDAAPAILRAPDGQQQRGKIEVLSLNGGLLQMSSTFEQGSRLKLLFVTQTGPVLGAVEMLPAVSTVRQPFRFVSIEKADHGRLRATVQSFLPAVQDAWIEKYRAATAKRRPEKRGLFRFLLRSFLLLAV